MTARSVLTTAVLGAGAVLAYARFVEPRWLERTHTRVPIPSLPAALRGLRLALLTDLHAGEHTSLAFIRRACRLAMAARPHLVALTGDFVSKDTGGYVDAVMKVLDEELAAPLGVFAVPGNHDHAAGIAHWYAALRRHPRLHDLTNRAVRLEHGGASVLVAGADNPKAGRSQPYAALRGQAPSDVIVLLTHNPFQAATARRALGRVDLVMSGHTHGGQVRLPFVGTGATSARHAELYEAGLVRRPWGWIYVSRGIGTVHLPMRFRCRPEVAILELAPA